MPARTAWGAVENAWIRLLMVSAKIYLRAALAWGH